MMSRNGMLTWRWGAAAVEASGAYGLEALDLKLDHATRQLLWKRQLEASARRRLRQLV